MLNLNTVDDGLYMRDAGIWTKEKLDYLNRYIDIFETAMRSKFKTRFYVDLLSGPGKNRIRQNNEIILGSPLISLNTKFPFSHYIFNEYDKKSYLALVERCRLYSNFSIKKYNQDCNEVVGEIVEIINSTDKNSLNLGFIDPEGFEVKWSTIETLASLQRMDLLIYYPQMGLNQNMTKLFDSPDECVIDRFFGTRIWREVYKNSLEINQKNIHRELIDLYKEKLGNLGYIQVLSVEKIGTEPLIRNSKRNAPLYRLLYASKHKLGYDFWKKITQRNIYGQGRLF